MCLFMWIIFHCCPRLRQMCFGTDFKLRDKSSSNLKPWTLIVDASSLEEKQICGGFPFIGDHAKLPKCAFNFAFSETIEGRLFSGQERTCIHKLSSYIFRIKCEQSLSMKNLPLPWQGVVGGCQVIAMCLLMCFKWFLVCCHAVCFLDCFSTPNLYDVSLKSISLPIAFYIRWKS